MEAVDLFQEPSGWKHTGILVTSNNGELFRVDWTSSSGDATLEPTTRDSVTGEVTLVCHASLSKIKKEVEKLNRTRSYHLLSYNCRHFCLELLRNLNSTGTWVDENAMFRLQTILNNENRLFKLLLGGVFAVMLAW